MTEEDRISKNLLILMFVGCIILLVAVCFVSVFYSPKQIFKTSFSSSTEDEISTNSIIDNLSSDPNADVSVFPVDINFATEEELQLIPDIGPSTAALIIEYRNEYGTIISFDELLSINGIGKKTVERLKEYCIIK